MFIWISVAAIVTVFWLLICNTLTCRQRLRMVDPVFNHPDWERLCKEFKTVTYEAHLFALATFRNPMRLYSADFREAAK